MGTFGNCLKSSQVPIPIGNRNGNFRCRVNSLMLGNVKRAALVILILLGACRETPSNHALVCETVRDAHALIDGAKGREIRHQVNYFAPVIDWLAQVDTQEGLPSE